MSSAASDNTTVDVAAAPVAVTASATDAPDMNPEHVKVLVDAVHEFSRR
jgi:hypothetical protein